MTKKQSPYMHKRVGLFLCNWCCAVFTIMQRLESQKMMLQRKETDGITVKEGTDRYSVLELRGVQAASTEGGF